LHHTNNDLRSIAPTVSALLGLRPPREAEVDIIENVVRDLDRVSRLAMIVIDAFGMSTWVVHQKASPTFNLLAERSLRTLRSVNPPKTPVAFASMATGASPETHGVRVRTDPLLLETIFEILREAGKTSAVAARETSSPNYLLAKRADFRGIAESGLDADVLSFAEQIIKESRPDFLLIHFLDVDNASHAYGPGSQECGTAISVTDGRLRTLMHSLAEKEYALLVLADHGQHLDPSPNAAKPGQHDGSVEEDFIVPLTWANAKMMSEIIHD